MVAKTISLLTCVAGLLVANAASADNYEQNPEPYSYGWNEPGLMSGIGVGFTIGGGIAGFTDSSMRNALTQDIEGLWDFRASIGTHVPLGLEVSYLGTAANVQTLNGSANGHLIGTTVEAALRWNVLPHYMVDPYIFAGAGWQRYDVNNMRFATSDTGMRNSDNVAEFPMGVGVSFRDPSGWMFDLRGTFRATTNSNLLLNQRTNSYADLHWWEASAALGYEF